MFYSIKDEFTEEMFKENRILVDEPQFQLDFNKYFL